jgi:hypothetical protein
MPSFAEYMLGSALDPNNSKFNERLVSPYLGYQVRSVGGDALNGHDAGQQIQSVFDSFQNRGINPFAPVPTSSPSNSWLSLNELSMPDNTPTFAGANQMLFKDSPWLGALANQQAEYNRLNMPQQAAPSPQLYGGWNPSQTIPFIPQYQPLNMAPTQQNQVVPPSQSGYSGSMPGFSANNLMSPINPMNSSGLYSGLLPKF